MDSFSAFVLFKLPYVAVPFYAVMLCVRFWVWLRFYIPALTLLPGARGSVYRVWKRQYRPTTHLFPGPRKRATEVVRTIKGLVFFTGLWKRDKALWVGSWTLHVGLGLFLLGHIRVAWLLSADLDRVFFLLALWGSGMMAFSGVYLLLRRLLVARVRQIADARDYLSEVLLLAVSATAFALGLSGGIDAAQVRTYLIGLATFSPVMEGASVLLVWHVFFLQVLLVVMPFSHLMHFGGIFLTRAFLRSSDSFAGEFGDPHHNAMD